MAVTLFPSVRSSTATSHSSSTLGVTAETVNRPLLVEAGDLLVLYTVMDSGVLADMVPPAGFTQLGGLGTGTNNPVGGVAYKVADGSEPSSYTYQRFSGAADGASLMVAVRDWDGNTNNLRYSQQETTRAEATVPPVTPATATGLVLTSAHHDATTATTTWGWVAPGTGLLAGVAHNTDGWSSIAAAAQPYTDNTGTAGLAWEARTASTVTPMVTTALTIGGPGTTRPTPPPAPTAGTGGPLTDRTGVSFSDGTKTATYHCYAAGLDWTRPVGLLIYGDGSAEFGLANPTSGYLLAGDHGLVAVAKRHNMILLTPRAPGNGCNDGDGVCWYDTSTDGTTPAQKLAWSQAVITHILGQYNIDRSRIVAGGYSSGAQWVTRFWGPAHAHTVMTGGVIVPIAFGGAPSVPNNNTAAHKAAVAMHWDTGEHDSATTTASWGSLGGHDYYAANGYRATVTVVGGLGHSRYVSSPSEGEFGRIVHDAIVRHVAPAASRRVLARRHVDLTRLYGVSTVRTYYLVTTSPPGAPTQDPPGGGWSETEPAYVPGTAGSLYTVDLVVFLDGTFEYRPVQKSGAYEAAKAAHTAAAAAEAAAGQASTDAAAALSAAQAALDAAQNASGKQQVFFGPDAPTGDPDVLWITPAGVPHQWTTGPNLVPDPAFTDPDLNAARTKNGWTVGDGAATFAAGGAQPEFYYNATNWWDDPTVGLQPGKRYVFAATFTMQSAVSVTLSSFSPWTNYRSPTVAAGAPTRVETTAPFPWPSGATVAASWVGGPGTITDPVLRLAAPEWQPITDARIVAAAQAAAAAQATAQAALDAAQAADAKAGQALTSASGRNSRIISLTTPSGTVNPTTGLPLVTGDTWWRWDSTTARNVIGAWVWNGQWRAETLTDSVLGSLDVNKLLVLGTARMTEAVVQKIMGDAAYFNLINVEDLTVTGSATINEAVVAKMAAALIVTQVLRTQVDATTGLYAIMDSYGFRVIDNDGDEGGPETIVALGPSGQQLLQLGAGDQKVNINSSGGVTAHTGTFQELWVNGRPIRGDVSVGAPRGNVAWGQMLGGYSNWMTSRDMVLGIEADLEPGRVYAIESSTTTVETDNSACIPMLCLHYTLNGQFPGSVAGGWDGSRVGESIIGAYPGFRSLPGLRRIIDLRNATAPMFLRGAVTLARYAGSGQCRVAAPVQPCRIEVTDLGNTWTDRGRPLYAGQSGEGQAPRVRTIRRFRATGWRTYLRGGAYIATDKPTQGRYSTNRECIFMFDDMVAPTAGAILHRVTCTTIADHWDGFAGGTGRWHRHAHYGGFPATTSMVHMVDTPGWPRGARMSIDLNKPERDRIQNGTMRGFGFSAPDGGEFYGKFSPNTNDNTTFIEIDMEA